MKFISITDATDLEEVARIIFQHALRDPQKKQLFDELLADPEADRHTLLATAFTLGVTEALSEMRTGHFIATSQPN